MSVFFERINMPDGSQIKPPEVKHPTLFSVSQGLAENIQNYEIENKIGVGAASGFSVGALCFYSHGNPVLATVCAVGAAVASLSTIGCGMNFNTTVSELFDGLPVEAEPVSLRQNLLSHLPRFHLDNSLKACSFVIGAFSAASLVCSPSLMSVLGVGASIYAWREARKRVNENLRTVTNIVWLLPKPPAPSP